MIFQRKGSGVSWLLVGLGNPGSKYESTRHNMGFLAVDGLARRKGFRFNKLRFRAWTAEWMVNGEKVLVMKPQTYMNLSGESVAFLTEGRTYGPHGADLVAANSIEHYDDALSRELTERVVQANLEMRRLGFKPYVAPALSSGALSLLACLRGQWHCSSTYLDGVFMGARNRLLPTGTELERLPLPEALQGRLADTMERLRAIR